MHSSGYRICAMMRGFNVGSGDAALKWFEDRLKVYPLAEGAQKASFVNASKMGANTLLPEDGTAYLTASKDKDGKYLMGAKNYRLRVPANAPAKRFWAVKVYDPESRSLLASGGNRTVGSMRDPEVNSDGSVDIYFGAELPKGKEKNWIKTDPDKGFFVVFRFYGPLEGYIDKTWVLNDFGRL